MAKYEVSYKRKNTGKIYSTAGYRVNPKDYPYVTWTDLKVAKSKSEAIKNAKATAPIGSKGFVAKRRLYGVPKTTLIEFKGIRNL